MGMVMIEFLHFRIGYLFIDGDVIESNCGNDKIMLDVRLRQK
jgi:hypothetical protein